MRPTEHGSATAHTIRLMAMTLGVVLSAASAIVHAGLLAPAAADDVLTRMRATYGDLASYSDTGTVLREFGVSSRERHTFITAFMRAPRRFYLRFDKVGGDQHVIWGDPDAFHTWTKVTGVQSDYPNPNNVGAITLSAPNMFGAATKVPTLLYAKASIPGDFSNLKDISLDQSEAFEGHQCHRIQATATDVYGTGRAVNVRKMLLWIDAESLLIRKVVEEWPPLPGQVNRTTTTFQPQANPTLDDARFRFTPAGR